MHHQYLPACGSYDALFSPVMHFFFHSFCYVFARYAFCNTKTPLKKWLADLLGSALIPLFVKTPHRFLQFPHLLFLLSIFEFIKFHLPSAKNPSADFNKMLMDFYIFCNSLLNFRNLFIKKLKKQKSISDK